MTRLVSSTPVICNLKINTMVIVLQFLWLCHLEAQDEAIMASFGQTYSCITSISFPSLPLLALWPAPVQVMCYAATKKIKHSTLFCLSVSAYNEWISLYGVVILYTVSSTPPLHNTWLLWGGVCLVKSTVLYKLNYKHMCTHLEYYL